MDSKRRIGWVSAVLLALAVAVAPGCSDDGSGGSEQANNGGLTEDGGDASDTGLSDSGDSGSTDASDLGGAPDGDAYAESDALGDADEDGTDGGGATHDDHTGCAYPPVDTNCPDGPHGPGSFLNEFVVKESRECCYDFDDDNEVDSAVGDLAARAKRLLGTDFNTVIEYQIQNGALVYLLEYAYWSDANNDPALEMDLFFGQDTDDNFDDNLGGTGDFYINPESLSNGEPRSSFPVASVSAGQLTVSGGSAPLSLPVGADLVEVNVEQLGFEADVVPGAGFEARGRVELTNGRLWGMVSLEEIFRVLNDIGRNCTCISTEPVFSEKTNRKDDWQCNSTQQDRDDCQAANASEMCQTLANPALDGCEGVALFLSDAPDLDTDGDDSEDTLSLGATFEAVGAEILGVAP